MAAASAAQAACCDKSVAGPTVCSSSAIAACGPTIKMFSEEKRLFGLKLLHDGYSMAEAAALVGCSEYSLRRWRQLVDATGTVWPQGELRNKHADAAVRNEELVHAVMTLVDAEPVAFLREHSDLLVALAINYPDLQTDFVSPSTIHRILTANGYTRKRVERLFQERSLSAQQMYVEAMSVVPLRCVVSVDETHTDGSDVFRRYGRSDSRSPCVLLDKDPRTVPRTSTMMGVSLTEGVLWSQTVVLGRAQTAVDWRLFLQCLNEKMGHYIPGLPWDAQPPACVLLYDNAGIHDADGDAFMTASGIYHIRLPPYSPNLQPIEGVFNDLKVHVRDLVYANALYLERPRTLMAHALARLTKRQIRGQFRVVARNMMVLLE